MHFQNPKTCGGRTASGSGEPVHAGGDVVDGQFRRSGQAAECHGARAHRGPITFHPIVIGPWPTGGALASGMHDLNSRLGALAADEAGDPLQRGRLPVIPQSQVIVAATTVGMHGGGFDHDQCSARDGA